MGEDTKKKEIKGGKIEVPVANLQEPLKFCESP